VAKVRIDGKKVKALREALERGATQKEFSDGIRVSERQLRDIENLGKRIDALVAQRIAVALDQPLEALLLKDEGPKPDATATPGRLIALGPDIVVVAEVTEAGSTSWSICISDFVIGAIGDIYDFIDKFPAMPPYDRYLLVNELGDGRSLVSPPTLLKSDEAYLVRCPIAPGFARKDVARLNQIAISPKSGDLFLENGSIARAAGVAALPQSVRQVLSMHRGESPFQPDFGARLADYFNRFGTSPLLHALLKLEVVRLAAIPYVNSVTGNVDTPLHCIEQVLSVEPLADKAENGRLPMRFVLDVNGLGRWDEVLSISMPDAATLEHIRQRRKALAPIYSPVVSRGQVEAVPVPDAVLRAVKGKWR
jgi:transcriptional regulator with XRE-family HTH domain